MGIFNRKLKIKSEELARVFGSEFIINPEAIPLPSEIIIRDETNLLIYRIALILLALKTEEVARPQFISVTKHLENLIFKNVSAKADLRDAVALAVERLRDLIFDEQGKELSWAISWLSEVGVTKSNPVDIVLTARAWMSAYLRLKKAFEKFDPY